MPDADLSLAILNGTSNFFDRFDAGPDAPQGPAVKPDPLTDRALSILGRAGGDEAPPEQPQASGKPSG